MKLPGSLLYMAASSYQWGHKPHRAIARVAHSLLSDRTGRLISAQQSAEGLVSSSTASRYASSETLEDMSVWADSVVHNPSSKWAQFLHYRPKAPKDGSKPIADSINHSRKVAVSGESMEERGDALKYLIHLIADLHAPLHIGGVDKGHGLDVSVKDPFHQYFPGLQKQRKRGYNLHEIWDTQLIQLYLKMQGKDLDILSREIIDDLTNSKIILNSDISIIEEESQDIADRFVYTTPSGHLVGGYLPLQYIERAGPVLINRIRDAGVRTASILNEIAEESDVQV
jgi:hypothetical protein